MEWTNVLRAESMRQAVEAAAALPAAERIEAAAAVAGAAAGTAGVEEAARLGLPGVEVAEAVAMPEVAAAAPVVAKSAGAEHAEVEPEVASSVREPVAVARSAQAGEEAVVERPAAASPAEAAIARLVGLRVADQEALVALLPRRLGRARRNQGIPIVTEERRVRIEGISS